MLIFRRIYWGKFNVVVNSGGAVVESGDDFVGGMGV